MAGFNDFCAVMKNNCGTLKITDNTGVYHATTNPLGWGAPSTILSSALTAATITYLVGDGDLDTDGTTVSVLANIPNPVVGSFILKEIDLDDYADGYIQISYVLTTASATYTKTKTIFFTCNVRCCINSMWATIATDCDCTCESNEKIDNALMAEGLLKAVNSAASCVTTAGRASLLAKIQRLCDWESCGCND